MIKLLQINRFGLVFFFMSIVACSDRANPETKPDELSPADNYQTDPDKNTDDVKEPELTKNSDPDQNPPLPPPEKPRENPPIPPEDPPEEPKPIKTPPGVGLRRTDLPPRSQFAKEDEDALDKLLDEDVEKAYRKIAEIYQFDGFRAEILDVSVPELTKQTSRVLFLTYDTDHMVWAINFLAGLARDIHHNVSIQRYNRSQRTTNVIALEDREWASFRYLNIASLSDDRREVLMQEDLTQYAGFLKFTKDPWNERVKEFWPEARLLEIDFGKGARIALIYPSVNRTSTGRFYKVLKGEVFFQTPWILRALEGEALQAIWHSSTTAHAEQFKGYQFEPSEKIRRAHNRHNLFEEIWDERSLFFPKREYAFRFIDHFVSYGFCAGMHLFGINELQPAKISDLRNSIADLNKIKSFTFKNTIQ